MSLLRSLPDGSKQYTGLGRTVTVKQDGAISVCAGDTLGFYAKAIFDSFDNMASKFGRGNAGNVRSFAALNANINIITAGETIYLIAKSGTSASPNPSPRPSIVDNTAAQMFGSIDCGYFSGFAIAKYRHGGANINAMRFSREDVYRSRNSFEKVTGTKALLPFFGANQFLTNERAPSFLRSMGIFNYRVEYITERQVTGLSSDDMVKWLLRLTVNGTRGIMIASGLHWIAVFFVITTDGLTDVMIFDPYGQLPGGIPQNITSEEYSGTACKQLCLLSIFDFQHYLSSALALKTGVGRNCIVCQ